MALRSVLFGKTHTTLGYLDFTVEVIVGVTAHSNPLVRDTRAVRLGSFGSGGFQSAE
jgi:hypothetical protein